MKLEMKTLGDKYQGIKEQRDSLADRLRSLNFGRMKKSAFKGLVPLTLGALGAIGCSNYARKSEVVPETPSDNVESTERVAKQCLSLNGGHGPWLIITGHYFDKPVIIGYEPCPIAMTPKPIISRFSKIEYDTLNDGKIDRVDIFNDFHGLLERRAEYRYDNEHNRVDSTFYFWDYDCSASLRIKGREPLRWYYVGEDVFSRDYNPTRMKGTRTDKDGDGDIDIREFFPVGNPFETFRREYDLNNNGIPEKAESRGTGPKGDMERVMFDFDDEGHFDSTFTTYKIPGFYSLMDPFRVAVTGMIADMDDNNDGNIDRRIAYRKYEYDDKVPTRIRLICAPIYMRSRLGHTITFLPVEEKVEEKK